MDTDSIIIAIASPPRRSTRGVIRISGPGALDLLLPHLRAANDEPLPRTRGLHRAQLSFEYDKTLPLLALLFPAPHSYTGEDAAELQPPGNPVLLERIVDFMIENGRAHSIDIRRAEPGEFTARAFFNGRLSLTEAEGVNATIAAQSDAELRAAGMLRHGALGRLAAQLADDIATALALVEAGIDFTDEEDVVAITPTDLLERLHTVCERLQQQLERAVGIEQLEAIPWVVLTGPPNAGKSTLFNALLDRERAVVADVAGTTRDVIAEPLHLQTEHGDAEVMLVDLAGLDVAADDSPWRDDPAVMNRLMQHQAHEAIARAELVLHCVPCGAEPPSELRGLLVRTKADLVPPHDVPGDGVVVSATSGTGLDDLRRTITARLSDLAVMLSGDAMALMPRHESAMHSAAEALDEAIAQVQPIHDARHLPDPELIAASMRRALDCLGALAGKITPDDVLGRIFASFCIGK